MIFSTFKPTEFNEKKILLFDIDGTLLSTGGIGKNSFQLSFKKTYGIELEMKYGHFAGKTDHIIHSSLVKENKVFPNLREFKKNYFKFLKEGLTRKKNPLPLPGISEFCKKVSKNGKYYLSLLTGNWRYGAYLKIKYYGLLPYFKNGIFGDGISDRNILGKIAREKFKEGKELFIIGDTPSDIECARSNGLKSIAVCTGPYDKSQLIKFKPDLIVRDFTEMDKIFKFLNS